MTGITSWGRVTRVTPQLSRPAVPGDIEFINNNPNLAVGLRRSYGNTCLLAQGQVIETTRLRNLISFDRETGLLEAESGISFAEILEIITPSGWFLPVTPGTGFVTLGGAIASDVHGKNHHVAGTFGNYVKSIELLRSDKQAITCSPAQNKELFQATIGGLGMTGIIKSACIQLIPVRSTDLETEIIKFNDLDEFFTIADESEGSWPYTVAWVDCFATGKILGRGLFSRGRFCDSGEFKFHDVNKKISILFDMPGFVLNKYSMKLFNNFYFNRHSRKTIKKIRDYSSFFYPLDSILNWNRLYGKKGFYQYQCVIPHNERKTALHGIMDIISKSGQSSFLAVLKTFGDIKSPGLVSFPVKGVTLALDFPNRDGVLELFTLLDKIVINAGGRLYPAKDGRIPPDIFKECYPAWQKLEDLRDPAINSLFWQGITNHAK